MLRSSSLFALALLSCASPRTALVVVVESDLEVPPLASVHAEAGPSTHDFTVADGVRPPFSFGVESQSGSTDPVTILLEARDADGHVIVTRRARIGFVLGRTLEVHLHLDGSCEGVACGENSTCVAGECADDGIDASTLRELVAGRELDPSDAGPHAQARDASGREDADASGDDDDTGVLLPRSCADLPSGSVSESYLLDPNGPGGEAPIDVFCETSADGGGWALIAKVDPATTRLGFDALEWTAMDAGSSFGTNDTTPGDALLPAYWLLPVHELRIELTSASGPHALVASLDGASPAPLRHAMEPGGGLHIGASMDAWTTLADIPTFSPACVLSAVPSLAPATMPEVRVRVGVTASDDVSCAPVTLWVGLGADTRDQGGSCQPNLISAGAARVCNPGRHVYPEHALLFGR